MGAETAGTAYAALISDLLQVERDRKKSFEDRGTGIITTSGGIVTLLFGLGAVVTSKTSFSVSNGARDILIVASGAFLLAAIAGLAATAPLNYAEPTAKGLAALISAEKWARSEGVGERAVARAEVQMMAVARQMNLIKARIVVVALLLQIIAISLVALAVIVILEQA